MAPQKDKSKRNHPLFCSVDAPYSTVLSIFEYFCFYNALDHLLILSCTN